VTKNRKQSAHLPLPEVAHPSDPQPARTVERKLHVAVAAI
jgi:hypothetical protein